MQRHFIEFVLQIAAVATSVILAREVTKYIYIVPHQIRKQSPLNTTEILTIIFVLVLSNIVFLVAIRLLNKEYAFENIRRFFVEGYGAMAATSVGCSIMFLLFDIPFSANFYAWIFLILFVIYFIIFFIFGILYGFRGIFSQRKSFASLIFSFWTILTVLIVSSPAALALLYKANSDFSNAVNELRSRLSGGGETAWKLVAAFPPHSFEQPMAFAFEAGHDDRIVTLSRTGRLKRHVFGDDRSTDVLVDLSQEVANTDNEMGAYNFVLHPEYGQAGSPNAGFAYVYFTHVGSEGQFNRLVRFDLSLPSAEARQASRTNLWDLKRIPSGLHNGGGMAFDDNGFLLISVGDFNHISKAQTIDQRLLSGIFRIDVDQRGGDASTPIKRQPEDGQTGNYFIPTDNPWYGQDNVLEEYWALGFRNPWRLSFDTETGTVWLGDVGRDEYEEHNRVEAGDNAAWPFLEGPAETEFKRPETLIGNEIEPIYYYAQTALARAAMGGIVYRGDKHPELRGQYIFADNQAATLSALDPDDPMGSVRIIARGGQYGQLGMTSLSTDDAGEIYVTLLGGKDRPSGEIVRLVLDDGSAVSDPTADDGDPGSSEAALVAEVDTKYLSVCSRCHGETGDGAPELDLGTPRPDFTASAWQEAVTDDQIAAAIIGGGEAVGKSAVMPAWEDFFTEEEMDILIQKIRGFGP